ncbi:MAG: GNAT family N-acetyltransferase [Halanaerobiales bacterium]
MSLDKIEIVEYQDKYKDYYRKLACEWLNKYDLYEPVDEEIINNPYSMIIDNGGYIYFARYKEEIVGTVSLFKLNNKVFELGKLAVTGEFQGLGIGNKLVKYAIDTLKKIGAQKVILYSNSRLKKAANLYKKFGFTRVSFDDEKYETADIKMEKIIDN